MSVMTALSAGGRRAASWRLLKPPHEMPVMPTAPEHHGCAAIQAMTSSRSSCSCGWYSSSSTPSDSPLPRRSTRTQAYPRAAQYGWMSTSRVTMPSLSRYGTASRMPGTGSASASAGSHTRAASRVPSRSGIQT